jgi:uncharacterized protein YjbI with pentapeptide repeats
VVDQQQQSRWQTTGRRVLWAVIIGIFLVVLFRLIRFGYAYQWTGFGQSKVNGEIQPSKTLWDWLELLIVPLVLAIGGFLFARSENRRAQYIANQRAETDRQIATQGTQDAMLQAYLDQMENMLLDKERSLLKSKEDDEVRTLARARTLPVLERLDGHRKGSIVQFLYESGLISTKDGPVVRLTSANLESIILTEYVLRFHVTQIDPSKARDDMRERGPRATLCDQPIPEPNVDLSGASLGRTRLSKANMISVDLSEADLSEATLHEARLAGCRLINARLSDALLEGADLRAADLRGATLFAANLSGADLTFARLNRAKLSGTDLRGVKLYFACLPGATLSHLDKDYQELHRVGETNLSGANLSTAYLKDADLRQVDMTGADLTDAILTDADLSGANLTNAKVTEEQLAECKSLAGGTMPNGQKYEDWLKSKGRREEGENPDPS